MKYWSGKIISALNSNQIFVFGSNPEGRHGMGAAKSAMQFGAIYGKGRGLFGQTYALVTKNLKEGFYERSTGITYQRTGSKSVTEGQIASNILELYKIARSMPDKEFLVAYQNSSKNLNGYSPKAMFSMFQGVDGIPENVLFHDSFKPVVKPIFKVLVYGGRDYKDFANIARRLDHLLSNKVETHKIVIVSGKAQGAGRGGEVYAYARGYEIDPYPADWKNIEVEGAVVRENAHGKYNAVAGHMRNDTMADVCDVGVGFWDGKSKGTADMTDRLMERGKKHVVVEY